MKFRVFIILIVGLALPGEAMSTDNGSEASRPSASSNVTLYTVHDVLVAHRDDQQVILEGYILRKLTVEDDACEFQDGISYAFQDRTGEIVLKIDDKIFQGRNVTPETRVRLTGTIYEDWLYANAVTVDRLEELNRSGDAGIAVRGFAEEPVE